MLQFQQVSGVDYSEDGNGQYWRYIHLLAAYRCAQEGYLIIFLLALQMVFPVCLLIDLGLHRGSKVLRLDCLLQKLIVSLLREVGGSYLAAYVHEAVSVGPVSSSSESTLLFLQFSDNLFSPPTCLKKMRTGDTTIGVN